MTGGDRARPRALLLDRDGTIIEDVGYPRDPDTVLLLPGAAAALREAKAMGYRLVIVSNQSGVARGIIQPHEARAVQARVEELFLEQKVAFDGAWFCFHGPDDACRCRKPAPGMIEDAAEVLGLDLARSYMIGDKVSDLEAGVAAGASAIAFGDAARAGDPRAAASFTSWDELVAWLRGKS